jgi:hypothetical protein
VIKNPRLSFDLRNSDARHIDAVLVPLRDVDAIVASRVRAAFAGNRLRADGAFAGARTIRGLRTVALTAAYRVALDSAQLEIPITFIAYPRLATDVDYCFRVLGRLPLALDRASFEAAWRETMRPGEEDPGPLTASERVRALVLEARDLWVDVWQRRLPLRP